MASSGIVQRRLHQPLQVARLQPKVPRNSRANDGPKLLWIPAEHYIRRRVCKRLYSNHDFRLGGLPRLVKKHVREVATRDPDTVREARRHAGGHNDAEALQPGHRRRGEVALGVEGGEGQQRVGNSVFAARRGVESEEGICAEHGQARRYEVGR